MTSLRNSMNFEAWPGSVGPASWRGLNWIPQNCVCHAMLVTEFRNRRDSFPLLDGTFALCFISYYAYYSCSIEGISIHQQGRIADRVCTLGFSRRGSRRLPDRTRPRRAPRPLHRID